MHCRVSAGPATVRPPTKGRGPRICGSRMPSCRLSSLLSVAVPILASASTSARGGREMSLISGMVSKAGLLISKRERGTHMFRASKPPLASYRARYEAFHQEALREPDKNQSRDHHQHPSRRHCAPVNAVLGDEVGEPDR